MTRAPRLAVAGLALFFGFYLAAFWRHEAPGTFLAQTVPYWAGQCIVVAGIVATLAQVRRR